jgi:hypothetical protein
LLLLVWLLTRTLDIVKETMTSLLYFPTHSLNIDSFEVSIALK